MTIRCVACGRAITVPDERAANPRLKVKCGCGTLFTLAEAAASAAPLAHAVVAVPAARPTAAAQAAMAPAPARAVEGGAPVAPAPRPVATGANGPSEPARLSFAATAAMGAPPAPRSLRTSTAWRRCLNHAQVRSESVCQSCGNGYCRDCEQDMRIRNAIVCPACEALCVRTSDYEEKLVRDRQRARPMMEELGTIFAYPLRDPMAYVMLAIFTWIFAVAGSFTMLYGKIIAVLFSQGVLMAYCFTALSRVSGGNFKDFMPDIGDITDLTRSLRLGVTALVAGSGPLLILVVIVPGLAIMGGLGNLSADEPEAAAPMVVAPPPVIGEEGPVAPVDIAEGEAAAPAEADVSAGLTLLGLALWVVLMGGLALLWKLVYTPVALTVAGLSRSSISTLNPVVGFDTIRRMGGVYWQAMAIYTGAAIAQTVLGFMLGLVPLIGGLFRSFVDAYAYLVIGCTLGLAVFKKAPELGLD